MPPRKRRKIQPNPLVALTGLLTGLVVALTAHYVSLDAAALVAGLAASGAHAANSPFKGQ